MSESTSSRKTYVATMPEKASHRESILELQARMKADIIEQERVVECTVSEGNVLLAMILTRSENFIPQFGGERGWSTRNQATNAKSAALGHA
jgi:hypothetical protein